MDIFLTKKIDIQFLVCLFYIKNLATTYSPGTLRSKYHRTI